MPRLMVARRGSAVREAPPGQGTVRAIIQILSAARCSVRHLPRVLTGRPASALRVLCLVAFDFVHRSRTGRRLSGPRVEAAANLLDLGAEANAALDAKGFAVDEYRRLRRSVRGSEMGPAATEYLGRLRRLEKRRPVVAGGFVDHEEVVAYREAVAQVSLGVVALATLGFATLDEAVAALRQSPDTMALFRVVMLCQVIDDVLDMRADATAGLPSFLTGHGRPGLALNLTTRAASRYASPDRPDEPAELPLRLALLTVGVTASVVCALRRWELRLRRH